MAHIFVTGGLRLDGPRGSFADADLPGGQARVAFAALVIERRPLSRDALAEIVWDGHLPPKWEGALATIISKIRALITSAGLDGRLVLSTVGGTYRLVLPADSWVDLEDATRRVDRAEGAFRHGDTASATTDGTVAFGILHRPFLAGIDGEWVEAQRRAQLDLLYRCSIVLARAWIDRSDPGLGVTIAERAVQLDPLREVGHRLVIEGELARGDRGAALRAFARCEQTLSDELGTTPAPETCTLVDGLR